LASLTQQFEEDSYLPVGQAVGNQRPDPMTRNRVFALALPIIGENLLQTLVGAIDTLLVARVSKEAVAGVGTAVEFIFFIISVLIALEIGATVLVSQAYGAGRMDQVRDLARQSYAWGLLLAIPVSVLGYVAAPHIVELFGTEPDVADNATTYLQITAAMSIFLLMTFVGGAVFRGTGDSRTPLIASSCANVVNVVSAYLLIFGKLGAPELGVAGSAWAAALGRVCSSSILFLLLITGRRGISLRGEGSWRPKAVVGNQLFRLGLPASLEQVLASAGFMTMLAVVALIGTSALAAQQIAFTALAIAFMPAFGFGLAVTTLVGQSIGASNLPDAGIAARIGERSAVIWMAVGGLLYFTLASESMTVFTNDPEFIEAGESALRALAIGLPVWAVWSVYGGGLRGTGDTITPLLSTAGLVWASVFMAYIAVEHFGGGLGSVWLMLNIVAPFGALANRAQFW
jgi:MATE family, multidrug efflux pump